MRKFTLVAVVAAAALPSVSVSAQAATTPDQIICAMSGSCGANVANSNQQINISDEKSFSLVKTSAAPAARPAAAAPAGAHARPTARAGATPVAYAAAPRVHAGSGRMEMLLSFDSGSANLTDQAKSEARSFASAMGSSALDGMRFNVEGHTDAVGSRDYNIDLSQRRAQAVVDYLVGLGVSPTRLSAHGYGFDKPRSGLTPLAAGNRRVEFVKAG